MADVLGSFEQAVLLALLREKEAYGRSVLKDVEVRLDRAVSAGAVYATLDRLEAKGLISSEVGTGTAVRDNRPRRFYKVEADGIRALNEARKAAERMWAGVPMPVEGGL